MICHEFNCPNCGDTCQDIVAEGWTAYQCNKCGLPFVAKTVMVPKISTYRIVGFEIEDLKGEPCIPTHEEIEQDIAEDPEEILCVDCGKPAVPGSAFRLCAECAEDEIENQPLPISTDSVFIQCPNAPNSLYRLDGDYVEVKYKKGSVIRTTWSDIHMMCEEENPTTTIKELLGERANTNNVAAVNAFVRAVKGGLVGVDV